MGVNTLMLLGCARKTAMWVLGAFYAATSEKTLVEKHGVHDLRLGEYILSSYLPRARQSVQKW